MVGKKGVPQTLMPRVGQRYQPKSRPKKFPKKTKLNGNTTGSRRFRGPDISKIQSSYDKELISSKKIKRLRTKEDRHFTMIWKAKITKSQNSTPRKKQGCKYNRKIGVKIKNSRAHFPKMVSFQRGKWNRHENPTRRFRFISGQALSYGVREDKKMEKRRPDS